MATITTVIFDFYKVFTPDHEDTLLDYAQIFLGDKAHKQFNDAVVQSELNKINERQYALRTKKIFGLKLSLEQIKKVMCSSKIDPDIYRLFINLSKHYQTAIVSNAKIGWPELIFKNNKLPLPKNFFSSANIGARKPDPEILKHALRKLKIKAEQAVFIDDREKNIASAKKLGLKTIKYNGSFAELAQALKKLGVKVKI